MNTKQLDTAFETSRDQFDDRGDSVEVFIAALTKDYDFIDDRTPQAGTGER